MKLQTTKVFKFLEDSKQRITVMQGGTRSGKTYNILVWFIIRYLKSEKRTLTICRETYSALKNTVMRDFFEILDTMQIYDPNCWKATDKIYKLGSNTIEFRNLDDDMKVRGAKRDDLFVNEANETKLSIWKQLLMRTSDKSVIDYNPSDEFHWIYDDVIPREDCDFLKTTYKDNPFLPATLIAEIERLKEVDPNYWRIFGEGERGVSESTVYKNWELFKGEKTEGEVVFGLDFGFNHPTALIKTVHGDGWVYCKELIYQSQLTTSDLIKKMQDLGLKSTDTIYADNSRPETIQEIFRANFNIHPCKKGEGSVKAGIDHIKRVKLLVDHNSTNLFKELKSYKWKTNKNEQVLDEPVKINDDAVDALRYAFNEKIKAKDSFSVMSGFKL